MVQVLGMNMTLGAIMVVLHNFNSFDGGNYQNNNTVMVYTYRS